MNKCRLCGQPIENHYINSEEMQEKQLCFSCNFWDNQRLTDLKGDKYSWCVCNGIHYRLGDEDSKATFFRGFGGKRVLIKWNDGTTKESTNLWCQGNIPEHLRKYFPDNATLDWDCNHKHIDFQSC